MDQVNLNKAKQPQPKSKNRGRLQIAGIVLLVIAALLIFYAAVAYVAWQEGTEQRMLREREQRTAEIDRQFELLEQDLATNNVGLAQARIKWLQENAPNNPLLASAQATLSAPRPAVVAPTSAPPTAIQLPTNTPDPTITPTVEPTATPAPPPSEGADPTEGFAMLEQLIANERWQDAIATIVAFQLEHPNYERYTTDTMLFEAYIEGGIELTNGEKVALGLSHFEQAEKLGALPEKAVAQRYYSELYLQAVAYRGIKWELSVPLFEELCAFAPLFHESCDLLYESQVSYAELLLDLGEACPAVEQLEAALSYTSDSVVNSRYNEAVYNCNSATATPPVSGKWTPTPEATP